MLDDERRRDVATGFSAHAVRDHEEAEVRKHSVAVLIHLANATDIGAASGLHWEMPRGCDRRLNGH
jgi:hypothetical protein